MLLYEDIITGDEMVSDAYPITIVDDFLLEVDCQNVIVKKGADVDIGANPSAEDGEEEIMDDDSEQVNNVVHSFRLESTVFGKKDYLTYMKGYLKTLKAKLQETNPERLPAFETKATAFVKKVVGSFKDYDFYTGASMNPDGMVALLNYREDGVTPYITFLKDGLKTVKL
ncbi:hypothetical protein IWQ61_004728 [Dispira simplex]|nr:hypothetical protein IWQ61_004728 [Dispira simplex]